MIRLDNAREFTSQAFNDYYTSTGIDVEHSGQTTSTTVDESKTRQKRGRPVSAKDKLPRKKKIQGKETDIPKVASTLEETKLTNSNALKEAKPIDQANERMNLPIFSHKYESPEEKSSEELVPEEEQVPANNEISIHYMNTGEILDRNRIIVDKAFSFKVALNITRSNGENITNEFEMKDLDEAKFCLSLQMEHLPNGILVYQSSCTEKVLKQFYMDKMHPLSTPMVVQSLNVNKDPFRPLEEGEDILGPKIPYMSAIGALISKVIISKEIEHILPKFFYTHDLQKNGDIDVQQIRSSDNLADLFTKALPTATFKKLTFFSHWVFLSKVLTRHTFSILSSRGSVVKLMDDKRMTTYVTLQLHHGGYFKLTPLATMYLGGTVEMVDEIDRDLVCYFDLKKVIMSYGYPTTTTMYYLIPSLGLTKGLRVLTSNIEVREMLDVYKGFLVIFLYCEKGPEPLQIIYPDEVDVPHMETNVVHLDDESPKANKGNHEVVVDIPVDEGIGDDEDDLDYVADEEDGSDVSSTPSWMFENLEGPGDDDIFASKEQQNQAKDDKEQPEIEDYFAHFCAEYKFEVDYHNTTYTVDLKDKTCGCRQWDLTRIPYKHAYATIGLNKQKVEEYVHPCYSRDTYLGVYHHMIQPIPGKHDWVKSNQEEIYPPFMRRPSGRAQKSKKKGYRGGFMKLQCIGGKFGGSGLRFSVGVANRGGGQTGSGRRGGGKAGASRGGGRSNGPKGGGRFGATRGGGRVGATRGGGRAGATRGGGRIGGPRVGGRPGVAQTGAAQSEGGEGDSRGGGQTGATRGGGRIGGPRVGGRPGVAQTGAAQSEGGAGGWWW
ncbi:hypothetical protein RHSIM_Rhsim01G0144900 [Rhododendron simsii]|uniref:Zinc finger PMZ-type domain-containing protein n=1 Tax=Rhododendron simsii TaxID=118357 RepID=A0A834HVC3_RHOSS|nr:hypothetical protein RHSIM_Rhsim01G0144900 [Rhododendron simsii]